MINDLFPGELSREITAGGCLEGGLSAQKSIQCHANGGNRDLVDEHSAYPLAYRLHRSGQARRQHRHTAGVRFQVSNAKAFVAAGDDG